MIRWVLLLAASLLAASAAWAQEDYEDPARLSLIETGIFCVGETQSREVAPGTISGDVRQVRRSDLISSSKLIPSELGLNFGVRVQGAPGNVGDVSFRIIHPAMGANAVTEQSWPTRLLDDNTTAVFYTFDEPFEQVTGPWIFEASFEGRLLYRQTFTVVPEADAPPHLLNLCLAPPVLSLLKTK